MIRRLLLAMVLVLGTSMVSHAGTLVCGPFYGGPGQTTAVVYVFNAGPNPITFQSREMISQFDGLVPITNDLSGTTLNPGVVSGWAAGINDNQGYACRLRFNETAECLSAVLEMRDASGHVLASKPFRAVR